MTAGCCERCVADRGCPPARRGPCRPLPALLRRPVLAELQPAAQRFCDLRRSWRYSRGGPFRPAFGAGRLAGAAAAAASPGPAPAAACPAPPPPVTAPVFKRLLARPLPWSHRRSHPAGLPVGPATPAGGPGGRLQPAPAAPRPLAAGAAAGPWPVRQRNHLPAARYPNRRSRPVLDTSAGGGSRNRLFPMGWKLPFSVKANRSPTHRWQSC